MLKRTFKTHVDLGLEEVVYDALVELYWDMKAGKIPDHMFNMAVIGQPKQVPVHGWCGSPGCLMGHMRERIWAKDNKCNPNMLTKPLYRLFYPHHISERCRPDPREIPSTHWAKLTIAEATIALERFLEVGEDGWREATQHRVKG